MKALSPPPTLRFNIADVSPFGPIINDPGVTCGSSSAFVEDDFQFHSCPGINGGGPSMSSTKLGNGSLNEPDEA